MGEHVVPVQIEIARRAVVDSRLHVLLGEVVAAQPSGDPAQVNESAAGVVVEGGALGQLEA